MIVFPGFRQHGTCHTHVFVVVVAFSVLKQSVQHECPSGRGLDKRGSSKQLRAVSIRLMNCDIMT